MMKMILILIFLIPLSFLSNFWFMQIVYFLMSLFFLINFVFSDFYSEISYIFGLDLLSSMMVLLSLWICSLMILSSENLFMKNIYWKLFLIVMGVLLLSLLLTFFSMNLFFFYLFFEVSLIPVLILVVGWGYQPDRIEAGFYLFFYTLLFSLPMMISLFYFYWVYETMDMNFLMQNLNIYMYVCLNMVFMVKMPMFFIHLWLPKAHVEAPISGSMILAGVMLKLGGYGLIRVMGLFFKIGLKINYIFILISLLGGFYVSLICLRQSDMKSLIAYSSVAHMGLVLGGIMTFSVLGVLGAYIVMIGHGLCSSGLFCLANISYERVGSRSLYMNKGMMNVFPSLSMYWFLLSICNMAAPPSLNLLGEIILINSLVGYNYLTMIFLSLVSFFSAVYSLYLYSFSQHGNLSLSLFSYFNVQNREFLLLFLHWFPLNILFLKSDFFYM
uniref:NADH-ubiquinone oxidoreductase chain 4 n=1 Tax=Coleoptera sp. ACP-2013 TaxID=2485033 RepID=A0A3G3MEU8_9COLE|nr:NADH dehydrogenase subunit 4 [Coleoptera sp. ACP-2013]